MTETQLARFFDELDEWATARSLPVETVTYGEHEDQVIDLRRPGGVGEEQLVLVLHGGFWRTPFTRRSTGALAVALTKEGWPTANVEYRRLGRGAYRSMLDDVASARLRLSEFRTAVAIGHSAGGHLALWLAAEGHVDAAVAVGGVCDLGAAAEARLGGDAVAEFLGGPPNEVPAAYRQADPAARLPLRVRQILVHGTDDDRVPIDHARQYVERARRTGDTCSLVEVEADHFAPIDPRSSVFPRVVEALASLRPSPSAA